MKPIIRPHKVTYKLLFETFLSAERRLMDGSENRRSWLLGPVLSDWAELGRHLGEHYRLDDSASEVVALWIHVLTTPQFG